MESKLTMRHSGVELLRIFAACFVVATHYFNPQIGGALLVINGGGANCCLLMQLLQFVVVQSIVLS